eukprot:TRINITY_DN3905_c0_g1_i5.p3 TRINITY_DN3905_c0_g1~~TRINITY_DN3905_c0_g1_i5.p3  ORF type:complete len:120 (-),score=4.56 TRINITY_DN3905_c0_g1_i5:528-839(-)
MLVFVLAAVAAKDGSRPSGSRCPTGWTGAPPADYPVRHAHVKRLAPHAALPARHASRPRPRHRRRQSKRRAGGVSKAPMAEPSVVPAPLRSRVRVTLARVLHR